MIGLDEARAILRERIHPSIGVEEITLQAALGRVLAEPLTAWRDVPDFDNVAVDGFAFASRELPTTELARLRLSPGRAAAGHPFPGRIARGDALRVFTGAPLPEGCDTVVMWEEIEESAGTVTLPDTVRPGSNIRRAGEDISRGQVVLRSGVRLGPLQLGIAAQMGLARLTVRRRLRVALASNGDELHEAGQVLGPGGIYDANRPMLRALLSSLPVEVSDLGVLPDDRARCLAALMAAAADHDVLVTSGGASKGEPDHVVAAIAEAGHLDFWQLRMKPGRPLATGVLAGARFIGLPGNPVSAMVGFLLLGRPLLLRLAGAPWLEHSALPLPAAFTSRKRTGRTEIIRATLDRGSDGSTRVRRVERESSAVLTSMTEANGLIELAEDIVGVEPGDLVPFTSFADLGFGG